MLGNFVILLSLMYVACEPAVAQEADLIVVTAPSRSDGALKRQVAEFTQRVADNTGQAQFARRSGTYCPKIIGLPEPFTRVVLAKLEDGAKATHKVRSGTTDCKADVFIIFTEDASDLLERIRQRNPRFFQALQSDAKVRQLASQTPVKWWYGTELKGADGEPVVDGATYRTNASLISSGITITLSSTVVIVDVGRSDGYPLDSIASYVAMIAFAQIRPSDGRLGGVPSILGIFDRVGPRLSALRNLTEWDRAYLRALYRLPRDRPLWQQRSQLSAAMVQAIREAERAKQ